AGTRGEPAAASTELAETAQAVPAASPASDPVTEAVLGVVGGLTGYPRELLDLDLGLEAGLGGGTGQQAEGFAPVRGRVGIARQDNLKLRDFPTLAHVIGFVHDHAVPAQPEAVGTAPGAPSAQPAASETKAAPVPIIQAEPAFTGDMA